jgi:hypothetical protein
VPRTRLPRRLRRHRSGGRAVDVPRRRPLRFGLQGGVIEGVEGSVSDDGRVGVDTRGWRGGEDEPASAAIVVVGLIALALAEQQVGAGADERDRQEVIACAVVAPAAERHDDDHQDDESDERGSPFAPDLDERPGAVVSGEHEPGDDVRQEPGSSEDRQQDDADANEDGIDVEVAGDPAAHPGDDLVIGSAHEPRRSALLLVHVLIIGMRAPPGNRGSP